MKILHLTNTPFDKGQIMCRQSLTKALSKYCPNYYYNNPVDFRGILVSKSQFFSKSHALSFNQNIVVFKLSPWMGKIYRSQFLERIQLWRRVRFINKVLRANKESLVLYVWHYSYLEYTNILKYDLLVYHIYDDFFGYEMNLPNHVIKRFKQMEEYLIAKSDIIVVNGETLAKAKKIERLWFNCLNGVDTDLFTKNYSKAISKLKLPPKKIVGYFGMINSKIDFELFFDLTQIAPEYHFLLAGQIGHLDTHDAPIWERILEQPNVSHLGLKSQEDIAILTAAIDIGFMPYRNKGWAKYLFPVKLFQFLAAGKSAVSTPLPSLFPYSEVIALEKTSKGFKLAFDQAINSDSQEKIESRIQLARENSWDERARAIYSRMRDMVQ